MAGWLSKDFAQPTSQGIIPLT